MSRSIAIIEPNFEQYCTDVDVLRSRLYNDQEFDLAVMGTTINGEGKRVLVYEEEKLIDIVAERLMRENGCTDPDDYAEKNDGESPWAAANDYLSYKMSDYLYYEKPYAPVIVSEAIEDINDYEPDVQIYKLGNSLWIDWT